jgi:TusA-related sulfurtransferase
MRRDRLPLKKSLKSREIDDLMLKRISRDVSYMRNLNKIFEKLKPVIDDYIDQRSTLQKQITQRGTLPKEIIEQCKRREIIEVIKLDEEATGSIPDFIEWISENEISKIQCNGKQVYLISKKEKIEGKKGSSLIIGVKIATGLKEEEPEYEFLFPLSKFKKKPFFKLLSYEFYGFSKCEHITGEQSLKHSALVIIVKSEDSRFGLESINEILKRRKPVKKLRLLCEDCYTRIDKVCCEDAIVKRGFIYEASPDHDFDKILFEKTLQENNISFKVESEGYIGGGVEFYLPEFNVLIIIRKRYRNLKEIVEKLKPYVIVSRGKKEDIVDFLEFDSNIIIFDPSEDAQQRFFLFDKNKKVETDIERCCLHIVQNLEKYAREIRGAEHDKLVGALEKIGRDLGFIPHKELSSKGARVDLVWLDRKGEVFSAIEVETSTQWKKDVISTWETEPRLAIIVAYYKSEKAIKDMLQYVLFKSMPHKLFFINNAILKAYLIEKQSILKYYDIEKKEEISDSEIFEY